MDRRRRIIRICNHFALVWLALATMLLAGGCARLGPPLPPLRRLPPPAAELKAVQDGARLEVSCLLPAANQDGSKIERIRRVELDGRLLPPGTPPETAALPPPVAAGWEGEALQSRLQGRAFRTTLELGQTFGGVAGTLVLTVRFQNEHEHWSPQPPAVRLPVAPVGQPAAAPGWQLDKYAVHLDWPAPGENFDGSQPARFDGVKVYRRELPDGPAEEIASLGREAVAYADTGFRFDRRYAYAVSFFLRPGETQIRGAMSPWAEVDTTDVFPPDSPGQLSAVAEGGRVKLIWDPVPDPDLAGYLVFRQDPGEAAPRQLTPEPVGRNLFVDELPDTVPAGPYHVVAVDRKGNRSKASAPASFQPPEPR